MYANVVYGCTHEGVNVFLYRYMCAYMCMHVRAMNAVCRRVCTYTFLV
jgi:hypothetical protein